MINNPDEDDILSLELENSMLELESIDNRLNETFDEGFEWLDILNELSDKLEVFNQNMESLNQGITNAYKQKNSYFLNGVLLVGVISAYESFVHEFFNLCCSKQTYIANALKNVDRLENKDRNHLRLKAQVSEEDLSNRLRKATLHDPIQIANISRILFGLKMPVLEKEYNEKLLKIRNLFTHNGGLLDGKPINMTTEYVTHAYELIYELINAYVYTIKKDADEFLTQ